MSRRNGFHKPSQQISPIDIQYDFMDMVGKGTYGTAWIAKSRIDGQLVIIKAIKKVNTSRSVFKKEYKYSLSLSLHPYIIETFRNAYETPKSFVMVQEFAPHGDLFDAIVPEQGMAENEAKHAIRQISEALKFMHSKRLVHRDVKPENIVIMNQSKREIKLIDFGMTLRAGTHVARVCGSIPYTPPEICQASLVDGFYVNTGNDVWSLGVLLFCMLTGTFPWEQASPNDIHYKDFIDWQLSLSPDVAILWRKFTPEALALFQKMLNLDIRKRCKVSELQNYLQYPWLETNLILLDTCSEVSSLCRTPNPDHLVDDSDPGLDIDAVKTLFLDDCSKEYNQFNQETFSDNITMKNDLSHSVDYNEDQYFPIQSEDTVPHSDHMSESYVITNESKNDSDDKMLYPSSIYENSKLGDITIHTSNFNNTYANVSPRHSHHFSDGFLLPETDKNILYSDSKAYASHARGNSVSYNVSIC
ncbi:Serine/threonine-protein kinase SBK1-like [Oopsacas minuta]|uniref:Serine/threonine-protein kinase SBK1-like n=1 Tax=Oopsacas minuta TaxID=111878 RepID=A0AAV7JL12_9METZ|nr:Serine/threonine-protein kinase SBK1-like [Oopsacas minuta]